MGGGFKIHQVKKQNNNGKIICNMNIHPHLNYI